MKNTELIPDYKTKIFTGIRATGGLTIANVLGAVIPVIDLGKSTGMRPLVFVADLHALTDHEPDVVKSNINEVITDYIALGLNPDEIDVFVQSDIKEYVLELTAYLSRHVSVAEILRIPTLKEKIKHGNSAETANVLLALYPIMMASDILLQRSEFVPVGEDQKPHIEITRTIANKFNRRYGNVFPLPKPQEVKQLRILSLNGGGKMSKSNPSQAIFLNDTEKDMRSKIKTAQTAFGGEMPDVLQSHFDVAKGLAKTDEERAEIEKIYKEHMAGEKAMGRFKELLADIVVNYVLEYQKTKKEITGDKKVVERVLEKGTELATKNAKETMSLVHEVMY